jgi:hypothetical protein
MLVRDLTDDDIGRVFWVPVATGVWFRVHFLGFPRRIDPENGGWPAWIILIAAPTQPGQTLTRFRRLGHPDFYGVMVASAAEIHPVQIEWAVTSDGEIVEIGESAV